MCNMTNMVAYQLPDRRTVRVPFDVCRAASTVEYVLHNGSVVLAIICEGQR